jgi:hypothetical protein
LAQFDECLPAGTQSSLFMNTLTLILNFFLIALLIMTSPDHALAFGEGQSAHHNYAANQHGGISQRKAIAIAQNYIQGRVLDIRRHNDIYRVKILSEKGSIHVVQVNANDGEIITDH